MTKGQLKQLIKECLIESDSFERGLHPSVPVWQNTMARLHEIIMKMPMKDFLNTEYRVKVVSSVLKRNGITKNIFKEAINFLSSATFGGGYDSSVESGNHSSSTPDTYTVKDVIDLNDTIETIRIQDVVCYLDRKSIIQNLK